MPNAATGRSENVRVSERFASNYSTLLADPDQARGGPSALHNDEAPPIGRPRAAPLVIEDRDGPNR